MRAIPDNMAAFIQRGRDAVKGGYCRNCGTRDIKDTEGHKKHGLCKMCSLIFW